MRIPERLLPDANNESAGLPRATERYEQIDGLDAKIITAARDVEPRYVVGIHFAALSPGSEARATMVAECSEEAGVAEALVIFRSFRVTEP